MQRLLLLLLALFTLPAFADGFPVFRQIGLLDGLPSPSVEAIVQDNYGYIWIATQAGLVRHEGDRLNLLPRDPAHPDALPAQNVGDLHAHSDGMVWAALSDLGVVEIGPDLRIRRHLAPSEAGGPLPFANVWSMTEDCEGQLWMAFNQGGVGVYDPQRDVLRLILQDDESSGLAPEGFLTSIQTDHHCRIWLVQTTQLSVLDPAVDPDRFESVFRPDPGIRQLLFAAWIAEDGEFYLTQGPNLIHLGSIDEPLDELSPITIPTPGFFAFGVGGLPDGRVYLTTREGLMLVDPATREVQTIEQQPDVPWSLTGNQLQAAHLLDREGGLWIAVRNEGLVYLAPDHAAFRRYPRVDPDAGRLWLERTHALRAARDPGSIWVASEMDRYRLDLETGQYTSLSDLFGSSSLLPGDALVNDLREHAGGLLVMQQNNLFFVGPDAEETRHVVAEEEVFPNRLNFAFPADEHRYWIGANQLGMLLLDLETDSWEQFNADQEGRHFLAETNPLVMAEGPAGGRWMAGANAVYRYDSDQGFRRMLELTSGPIRDLAWRDERLWLASDRSLLSFDLEDDRLIARDEVNLSSINERSTLLRILVLPEHPGELWLVLRTAVVRYDLATGRFRSYTPADGLAVAEFSPQAVDVLDDGRIVVGGARGVVTIDPSQLRGQRVEPPVHLRSITAADLAVSLAPGERELLALDWQRNSVRFEFSALTYVASDQVRYRVQLEGWDDDWLDLGRQSNMYYSNLPPGRYRFQVEAATEDGVWGEQGDEFMFHIERPPWRSDAALAGYAVLLLGGGAVSWRQIRSSARRRRQLREASQKRLLAEGQRQLIQRLNGNLDPLPLAACIAADVQRLTAARSATLGYVHELMPEELVTGDNREPLSREMWDERLRAANGQQEQAVVLEADNAIVARVLLVAPPAGFAPDHDQRLALLLDVAGQALHNAILLQRVRTLAERAEQASRAKSEFLATMSHEIRTPLHGVLGMTELLHLDQDAAGRRDLLRTLRSSGQQLQRIIDDVLDISRIEAGRLTLQREPFEIISLLEQVVDLHASNAATKGLDLRLLLAAEFPVAAMGDAGRLAQILGNLVNNAVKFTRTGWVELAATLDTDGGLLLSVTDTGPGIPSAQRERLFQPFSQLDASLTRAHSGSGLGLAICRRLAEGLGAELRLCDGNMPGSRFELHLAAPSVARFKPPTRLLDGVRLNALVDESTHAILLELSRRWGFDLANGWDAEPCAGSVVFFDDRHGDAVQAAAGWLAAGARLLCLERPRPEPSADPLSPAMRAAAGSVRWPLVESRLIAALVDRRLGLTEE